MFEFLIQSKKQGAKAKIKVQKISSSKLTPLMVCEALKAPVLLESAFLTTGKGRFSILITQEAFRIIKEDSKYFLQKDSNKYPLNSLDKIYHFALPKTPKFLNFLEAFRALAPQVSDATFTEDLSFLPLPLGGVGYLGYEFFSEIEEVHFCNPPLYQASENAFIFGREFVIFDHFYEMLYAINVVYENETQNFDLEVCSKNLLEKLTNIEIPKKEKNRTYQTAITSKDKESYYTHIVGALRGEIYKGNLLQCVPSQSLEITSDLPPLQAYVNLRAHNPSPYMYYFDFGEYHIIGSSPEVLIRVQSDSKKDSVLLTTRPIAGTRPRGKNALEDAKLEVELKENIKENAEHLMLLDLGRNDIGRVALPNSVRVTQEKVIEKYARVMHLVSEVQGEMDLNAHKKIDALLATFPAGTVSGAPKIQAIKTIESLESHKRGIYAGAIGYFSKNGDMDFAITIRTAVYQNGVYYLQAGGGVVYDSTPKEEYKETQNKMLSLVEAIMGEMRGNDNDTFN
ncbi:anthranilate synthase component I family protein [Helicobacter turcicus]|uniref:Anthranilate synthase component 1 n=1 Tax=Helicobacter turcicus TaxID=2867412 RepID=A0ABS7JM80_9HELI|nr:chorismate-binding protein [Helicobacter turcicus]MBX7490496.1 chorismate-binding protein [Helicobacter turcicus]MBX7545356.1 chorismate-binding protein [Helicobacter turcicus]